MIITAVCSNLNTKAPKNPLQKLERRRSICVDTVYIFFYSNVAEDIFKSQSTFHSATNILYILDTWCEEVNDQNLIFTFPILIFQMIMLCIWNQGYILKSTISKYVVMESSTKTKISFHTWVGIMYCSCTGNRRQLCLPPLIWNVSHVMVYPLELLRPVSGFSADPSSSKRKIMRWETTKNSSDNKQMSHIRCV